MNLGLKSPKLKYKFRQLIDITIDIILFDE